MRGPEAVDALGAEEAVADDLVELLHGVVVELARRGLLQDRRELPLQLPGVEEELPVDERPQLLQGRCNRPRAGERGHRQLVVGERLAVRAGRVERQQRPPLLLGVLHAQPLLLLAVVGVERLAAYRVEQVGDDADHARGVEHVHGLAAVDGRDPDGRVLARGRGAADQQRQLEPTALHLLGHVHHLVERGRDQAREADRVGTDLDGGVEDRVARDHHAEVDHLVVVAAEDDADDVLADVVHVALDGRQDDRALRAPVAPRPFLLLLHVRLEVGDGALHRPRALDHLRQEHAAGAEEVADDLHPVHQRAFDHVERAGRLGPRLLRVLLDEVDDPVHERVLEPLPHRRLAPGEVELALRRRALHRRCERDEPVGRIRPPVVDHVLDVLEQVGRNVLVDDELARR